MEYCGDFYSSDVRFSSPFARYKSLWEILNPSTLVKKGSTPVQFFG